tara:strand:- start:83 stop:1156 length:1074 start_codon:yes stop_codon:yes gene_type:complete
LKKNNSFLKSYKNLKVLVTGSTGFKGAWLSNWLFLLGSKVVGVGLKPEKDSVIFSSLNLNKKINQYFIDIKNFNKINDIIKKEKPDIIFHLAAQSIVSFSYKNPLETLGTNIIGSANILESVRINKIPNLVYITSDKCYLNLDKAGSYKESDILGGLDNYSSSKASAELIFASYFHSYFKKDFLSIASARAGNVIGGGDFKKDRIVPDVIKSLKNGRKILLRNPNATRPWQHVLEPLSGYLILGHKLMKKELKSNLMPHWNFGPHKKNCKKVHSIVRLLIKEWGEKKQKIVFKRNKNFHESQLLSLNIEKAKKELLWEPRLTLNETVKFTIDWYKYYFLDSRAEDISNYQIDYYTDK